MFCFGNRVLQRSLVWPQTHKRFTCLCLPSAKIKEVKATVLGSNKQMELKKKIKE